MHELKKEKNMVYEKQEKLLNIQNVKTFILKNMPKSNIHPTWYLNTPVLCEGKTLCYTSSTKTQLQLDVWLGNHSFYTNSQTLVDSEGRIDKFFKKYNNLN
jgi:large subunit ribosomal protein L31